jgi:TolA-binding protein
MTTGVWARRITAVLAAILLGLASAAAVGAGGTIYKWTDKEGNVHFTDCPPPPGCKAETVTVQPAPNEQQIRQAQQKLNKLLEEQQESAAAREQERLERERQQVEALQVAVARKRACVMAQQNLHNLLMNRPVYYINEQGERVFLDEAAHKAEIERQRQLIRDNCNTD